MTKTARAKLVLVKTSAKAARATAAHGGRALPK